jgi:hypothetical protein
MSDQAPAHVIAPRRFRFGLRTLFVVMTLVSAVTAWVTYSMNWIRQRQEYGRVIQDQSDTRAPAGLWLFGEAGHQTVWVTTRPTDQEIRHLMRLFPEAARIVFLSEPDTRLVETANYRNHRD